MCVRLEITVVYALRFEVYDHIMESKLHMCIATITHDMVIDVNGCLYVYALGPTHIS